MSETWTQEPFDNPGEQLHPIQFVQIENLPAVPVPLARITTCGSFQFQVLHEVLPTTPPQGRYREVSLKNRPKGSGTALILLKILTSQPEYATSTDWLSEHLSGNRKFKEEDDDEQWERGMTRVDNVAGYLRGMLCPLWMDEQDKRTLRKLLLKTLRNHRDSGTSYQLATAPLVWLDVDEIAEAIRLACLREERGKDALPSWEQAYALASRGPFLPNEPYSDWATSKRTEIDGYLRQSVHALRQLLLLRYGETSENRIIYLLRQYWHTHITDEEALQQLMELLSKHGSLQEAQEYYQRLCEHLKEEGDKPNRHTQEVAQNMVRFTEPHYSLQSGEAMLPRHTDPSLSSSFSGKTHVSFSPFLLHGIIEAGQMSDNRSPQFLQETIGQETIESDNESVKRREATKAITAMGFQLLGVPVWEQLTQLLITGPSINVETLAHLEQLNDVCWRLANDSQRVMVAQILPTFLPKLTIIAGQPSPHQQNVARLVARGYILAAEVEKKNIQAMQAYCEYAVIYSEIANDVRINADALRQKATIALIAKEPLNAISTYQQVLSSVHKISPLLRSRIYLGTGSAYARVGQQQEALRYLGLARDTYPDHPEDDPEFLYLATSSDKAAHHLYEALTYSDLQQPKDSWNALMSVDGMHPKIPMVESTRIEFLNLQAKTAAFSGNMEQSLQYLSESMKVAKKSEYAIWIQEAYDVYLTLCQIWPHEKLVKNMAQLFQ